MKILYGNLLIIKYFILCFLSDESIMLELDQVPIFLTRRKKLTMRTMCYHFTRFEHIDTIDMLYSRETMCYDDTRATLHEMFERILDQSLGLCIESARGLIEDEDLRIREDGSCYSNTLLFSS